MWNTVCGIVDHMQVWRSGIPEFALTWFDYNVVLNALRRDS